ncbi:MAG: OprD family outer membrane porin [Sulfurovum sp.]|nr:OprD family outer membrane porin [Sulfurovum sp.]
MKYRVVFYLLVLAVSLVEAEDFDETEACVHRHSLTCNMTHIHEDTPRNVRSISQMFAQGIFYNRLRLNSFGYAWKEELGTDSARSIRKNHAITAVGASVIYRSAYFYGFSVGLSLYTSQAWGSLSQDEVALYKGGKDTFSRYDVVHRDSRYTLASLAESYVEYSYAKSHIKLGRQIFESFLTKSNDTKMIPNTFEGITLQSKILSNTSIKMAYLQKQKLRDHNRFHHVLAFEEDYSQNDDSAMHRGLSLSVLDSLGIEDKLLIMELQNASVENLTLYANYTAVPRLISSAMLQVGYRMHLNDWSIVPTVRYMQQFDEGAGAIAGANHLTLNTGYIHPNSLNSQMYAGRIDVVNDAFKLRFGYTHIVDKGDIIAPWRGFPTGGFSRAMSQYNWYANTKSYMLQMDYECQVIPHLKFISRFVVQDFDDNKIGVQSDANLFSFDILKILDNKKLYLKTRYAHVVGDGDTITSYGNPKLDPSYDELRFEINYLF